MSHGKTIIETEEYSIKMICSIFILKNQNVFELFLYTKKIVLEMCIRNMIKLTDFHAKIFPKIS